MRATLTNPATGAPSLYRDPVSGRPVEGEQIFGDFTARARGFGVPTPLLDLVTLHLRVHDARTA